ncbi:peptidylprolyl isomerase [SAR86 cluster bacterium]|nr:peptidylprolyl isomerase [SAR86 cluster bacterium]
MIFSKILKKFILFFIFFSLNATAAKEVLDKIAVIVGDGVVLESQFNFKFNRYIQEFLKQNPNQPLPPESFLKKQILENLIIEELLFQKAKKFGVRISDQELNDYMERLASSNNLSLDEFINKVSTEGDFQDFRKDLRNNLIIQRVQRGLVRPKVFISDQEIKNYIGSTDGQNSILVEYKINQILVKSKNLANEVYQKLSDGKNFNELKKEYDESNDDEIPKWQKISELPSLFSIAKDMQIDDFSEALKSGAGYYLIKLEDKKGDTVKIEKQALVRHILVQTSEIRSDKQAEELIKEIKNRVIAGEEFRVLARLYSDDPGSKLDGGNLGWSTSDKYDPTFKKVIDESNLNMVSDVFKSSFGFHILEVMDRREKDVSSELQKDKAFRIIFERKYEEQLERTLQELRAESYVDIKIKI